MDNAKKKTAGGKVQNDRKTTAKSFGTDLTVYVKTEQVAKSIGVTKQTVEYWRKRGRFRADLVDHNGVYYYSANTLSN